MSTFIRACLLFAHPLLRATSDLSEFAELPLNVPIAFRMLGELLAEEVVEEHPGDDWRAGAGEATVRARETSNMATSEPLEW